MDNLSYRRYRAWQAVWRLLPCAQVFIHLFCPGCWLEIKTHPPRHPHFSCLVSMGWWLIKGFELQGGRISGFLGGQVSVFRASGYRASAFQALGVQGLRDGFRVPDSSRKLQMAPDSQMASDGSRYLQILPDTSIYLQLQIPPDSFSYR